MNWNVNKFKDIIRKSFHLMVAYTVSGCATARPNFPKDLEPYLNQPTIEIPSEQIAQGPPMDITFTPPKCTKENIYFSIAAGYPINNNTNLQTVSAPQIQIAASDNLSIDGKVENEPDQNESNPLLTDDSSTSMTYISQLIIAVSDSKSIDDKVDTTSRKTDQSVADQSPASSNLTPLPTQKNNISASEESRMNIQFDQPYPTDADFYAAFMEQTYFPTGRNIRVYIPPPENDRLSEESKTPRITNVVYSAVREVLSDCRYIPVLGELNAIAVEADQVGRSIRKLARLDFDQEGVRSAFGSSESHKHGTIMGSVTFTSSASYSHRRLGNFKIGIEIKFGPGNK